MYHNCLECKSAYLFYEISVNIKNCYSICENFCYLDKLNEFHCTEICQDSYNKTIIQEKKCIDDCKNDDTYKYEYNNTCYKECPKGTISDANNYLCTNIKIIETTFIYVIKEKSISSIEIIPIPTHINNIKDKIDRKIQRNDICI